MEDLWTDRPYRVEGSRAVTPVIRELSLTPVSSPLSYRPGQYVLLNDAEDRVPQRSYSVANMPRPDGRVTLLVTRVSGGPTSTWAHDTLRPGDVTTLEGPYGTFVLEADTSDPVLLLGAGSGLAPIRAIAEAVLARQSGRSVTLFLSVRTSDDAIDDERFRRWARDRPDFRYLLTRTRDPGAPLSGHVPALLPELFGTLRGQEVFAAGPPGFVVGCAHAAVALGADPVQVHTEEFFTEPQPWSGRPPLPAPPEVLR